MPANLRHGSWTARSNSSDARDIIQSLHSSKIKEMGSSTTDKIKYYQCHECHRTHVVADTGARLCANSSCPGPSHSLRPAEDTDLIEGEACRPTLYAGDIIPLIEEVAAAYVIWHNDPGALNHATSQVSRDIDPELTGKIDAGVVEHAIRTHFDHIDPP